MKSVLIDKKIKITQQNFNKVNLSSTLNHFFFQKKLFIKNKRRNKNDFKDKENIKDLQNNKRKSRLSVNKKNNKRSPINSNQGNHSVK